VLPETREASDHPESFEFGNPFFQENGAMKRTFIVVVGTLVLFQLVLAQAPPRAPKPGPEHKRMAYFAGNWTVEGEMKASPFGPGGKFTGADHNEMLGGFFLVLHSQGKGPMGDMKSLAVMGYDRDNKAYFYNEYASAGHMESAKGSITGDTWTWNSEEKMGAKIVKSRFTLKELSPSSYSMQWETQDGTSWSTLMEGKATKITKAK